MKTTRTTFFLLSLLVLASLPCFGLNYTITFTGSGASATVGDVFVQNITQGTSVTVPAGNVLNLSDEVTAVGQLSATDGTIHVYSNSLEAKSTVSFYAKQPGVTQINAFGIDGRKIAGITANLQAGMNSFQLSLPKGAYAIQVSGNGYTYSAKMINQSTSPSKPEIVYTGTEKPATSAPQKTKSTDLTTTMVYATGDQLRYTGTSGNYSTIVTDVPTGSKTTNFIFYPESNCYIVARNSSVSIPVIRANTANSANFSSSTVSSTMLWTTGLLWTDVVNPLTASGTIASIEGANTSSVETGFITVTTGSATGNAVVYVKNSAGNICWSWHIWVTDYDPNIAVNSNGGFNNVYYNSLTWMDRNLGATSNTHNVVECMGLYYQWGRKDPFPGPTAVNSVDEKTLYGTVNSVTKTPVAASPNLVNAIQNPATFYTNADAATARDWYTNGAAATQNNVLWTTAKTLYDPCPAGWKVPAKTASWASTLSGTWTVGEYGYMFTDAGWYEASRKRNNDTGTFGTVAVDLKNNGYGYYWTSTNSTSNPNTGGWMLYYYAGTVYPATTVGLLRANGASVRCVKESDGGATCTLNVAATNGTVVKNPDQTAYEKGTNVMLTATPNSGSVFVSWSGGATGSTNPLSVTMDASKNITANFISLSNSTAGIQALIDQCPLNGTVSIPAGTYMIDALTSLNLKSNMTLQMESGTILKAIPNSSETYAILKIVSVTNVNVIGGTLQGERHQHLAPGDFTSFSGNQWGMGVHIAKSSNVTIDGVTATQCWGDGFYIAGALLGGAAAPSANITIQNVVADDNRRQGLSIENVDGLLVQNSIFKNTNGQSPFSGIDIEPYADYQNVTNVTIKNNQIYGNQGCGIEASFYVGTATQRTITIEANDIHDNRSILSGLYLSGLKPGVTVKNNNIHDNQVTSGISLNNSSKSAMITGNTVVNNLHNSVIIYTGSTQNTITGNTFTGNGTNAILDNVGGNVISPNTVGP